MMSSEAKSGNKAGALALAVLSAIAVVLTWMSVQTDHLREADEVLHYLYAREVETVPMNLLHVWARPFCTLIWWPLASWSLDAVRWTSTLSMFIVGWSVWKCASLLKLKSPATAVLLVAMQTMVIALAGGIWTEWPFAAALGMAMWLRLSRRHVSAGVLMGLLPLMRPEGFIVGFVDGVCGLLGVWRDSDGAAVRWKSILGLPCGTLLWAGSAALASGDPLWLMHHWPHDWAPDASYGHGAISWIFTVIRDLLPWTLIPLLIVGVVRPLSRSVMPFLAMAVTVVVVHTILWATGSFGSAGYARYFLTISPILALLMAGGWERLGTALPRIGIARFPVVVLVLLWASSAWTESRMWMRHEPPPDARIMERVGAALQRKFPTSEAHSAHPFFYLGWRTTPAVRFDDMGDFSEQAVARFPNGALVVVEDRLYLPSTRNVRPERLRELGFEPVDLQAMGVDLAVGDTTRYPYLASFSPQVFIRR